MEINPQSIILPEAPLSNHTIRVDIQWSPASLPGGIMYYDLECDQNNYSSTASTTGANTYSHTSQGYENYPIQFRFGSLDPNQPTITGTYQLYYDEQLIRSASFQAQKATYSSYAYFNTHYQSPVLTDYNFSIYASEICPGSYEDIYITTSRNCNTTAEINTEQDSITLTIEGGREFVSFYKNGQKKDTVTFMFNELGSVYLRQDSIYTGTATISVEIKADWTGIIKYKQLVINPQEQFQIRVPNQPAFAQSGGTGGFKIEPYSSSDCLPYISENLRYTALIKKGSNRGLLYDYDTGISGDTLTNLTPQEDGEKYLDFITEGEILNEEDTVLVKIFTNNENIDTTEAVIIIYPNDLVVQIIPSIISQGDTARVVLKKRNGNVAEDFPPDKLFNVEIVQGLEYGLILDSLSNDTLTTFSNIPQGFKIIAKDSTGIDSTKIRIKVSTEESFIPAAKIITGDRDQINKDKNRKELQEKEENKSIIPNLIIPGTLFREGYGDVVVKQDECSPLCTGEPPFTNILTTRLYNIYFDPCENRDKDPTTLELGGFTPVNSKDKWRNPSYFHPCFDDVEQIWRFSMNDIQLFVAVDFCQNNLNKYQVIENISEVDSNEVCDAVKDFKDHEYYPPRVRNGGYMIMELLEKHEEIHERVYFEYMTENKQDFDRILSEFKPTCDQFPNEILAYAVALEKLDPMINSYFTNNYEKWQDDMGWTEPIDKLKRKQAEDKTQNHPEVQAIWINYIKSLEVLYPSKYKKCK